MFDVRVIKTMATWLFYIFAVFMLFAGAVAAGKQMFDADPDTVVNSMLAAFGLYTLYQMAKAKVDMERHKEQRLADKLRDMK